MNTMPPATQCKSSLRMLPQHETQGPLKTAEIIEISSRRRLPLPANNAERRQPGWAPKPRFILVASEDEYLWSSLRALLESSRFTACRFARPEDASRILRVRKVDLLVADVSALTSSESQLANQVSASAHGLPVLAICGWSAGDAAARFLEQRGWPSVRIPFRPPELLDAIEKVLAMQPAPHAREAPAASHHWHSLLPWLA